jgi:hypothetical protein
MFVKLARAIKIICLVGGLPIVFTGCNYMGRQVPASDVIEVGMMTDKSVDEASGIATSRLSDDVLWVNNDSGNEPKTYAINTHGKVLASLRIEGVANHDWEDLAAFSYQGQPYILIADIGDNDANRQHHFIYIIKEPDTSAIKMGARLTVKPVWSITFTYPDGKHDCESVAVDMVNQKILLLTKREKAPLLFELPLFAQGQHVATELGAIKPLHRASRRHFSLWELFNLATMPTGMDISPDGKSLVVITYGSAYQYDNPQHLDWYKVMQTTTPTEIALPSLKQAEAIGFDRDGRHIYITSEKIPSPLLKIAMPSDKVY